MKSMHIKNEFSSIFLEDAYAAFEYARADLGFTLLELEEELEIPRGDVAHTFQRSYHVRVPWRHILKIVEALEIPQKVFIRPARVGDLPKEMSDYIKSFTTKIEPHPVKAITPPPKDKKVNKKGNARVKTDPYNYRGNFINGIVDIFRSQRKKRQTTNIAIAEKTKITTYVVNHIFTQSIYGADWRHTVKVGKCIGLKPEKYMRPVPDEIDDYYKGLPGGLARKCTGSRGISQDGPKKYSGCFNNTHLIFRYQRDLRGLRTDDIAGLLKIKASTASKLFNTYCSKMNWKTILLIGKFFMMPLMEYIDSEFKNKIPQELLDFEKILLVDQSAAPPKIKKSPKPSPGAADKIAGPAIKQKENSAQENQCPAPGEPSPGEALGRGPLPENEDSQDKLKVKITDDLYIGGILSTKVRKLLRMLFPLMEDVIELNVVMSSGAQINWKDEGEDPHDAALVKTIKEAIHHLDGQCDATASLMLSGAIKKFRAAK